MYGNIPIGNKNAVNKWNIITKEKPNHRKRFDKSKNGMDRS